MKAGIPAAVAISAATTFDRIPPEPSGEVDIPISSDSSSSNRLHLGDQLGVRVVARVGGVEAVGVGQQHQRVGAEQDRHLRGEEVVVAEGDLVGGRRVVLVDDGHDPPVEQLVQRLARVQVVGARRHVEEREQHLRALHAALREHLVVRAVELALPHRRRPLELRHRRRPHRQVHQPHPSRDRARGDHHDVVARLVDPRDLAADAVHHVRAQLAALVGDDARAQLDDDQARHGPTRITGTGRQGRARTPFLQARRHRPAGNRPARARG